MCEQKCNKRIGGAWERSQQPACVSLNNELPGRTARAYAPLYERSTVCVLAAVFRLGSLSVAVEVYRARAINVQLCRKALLT